MKNVSHKKKWNAETVQVQVEPTSIPLIKVKTTTNWIHVLLKLNWVGIGRQKNWISMNLKWP